MKSKKGIGQAYVVAFILGGILIAVVAGLFVKFDIVHKLDIILPSFGGGDEGGGVEEEGGSDEIVEPPEERIYEEGKTILNEEFKTEIDNANLWDVFYLQNIEVDSLGKNYEGSLLDFRVQVIYVSPSRAIHIWVKDPNVGQDWEIVDCKRWSGQKYLVLNKVENTFIETVEKCWI